MTDTSVLMTTNLPLPLFIRGKVRDTFDLGEYLLIVATDRISAFDVVLPVGIPDKGIVLNQLSIFWFEKTRHIVPNHVETVVDRPGAITRYENREVQPLPAYLARRSMIVRKLERLPIECVARGYLSGSGWSEYQKSGSVCGISLPKGLKESQKLSEPIFTPTTKADTGHDMPVTMAEVENQIGKDIAKEIRDKCLAVYNSAHDYALGRGIIIADTKVEFGLENGKITLIDELLTPDSSRFWEASEYKIGQSQASYDKQPVRDWLVASGWDKTPPAPTLPGDVIEATTRRYRTAFERLTGKKLD
jgi:phosphoribosylaminoimidazole-succinocarboxamide synthase